MNNRSHLHLLSMNDPEPKILEFLVDNKCDINGLDNDKLSPLHYYCRNKRIKVECLQKFVELKADLNIKNSLNETPLFFLCQNENINMQLIKFMAENKADVTAKNYSSKDMLLTLCRNKKMDLEMAQFFVEQKCDPSPQHGDNPVGICSAFGHSVEIVKYFLNLNPNVLKKRYFEYESSPLSSAISSEKLELVQCYIEMKANLEEYDKYGRTLAHNAFHKDTKLLSYLLESGMPLFAGKFPIIEEREERQPRGRTRNVEPKTIRREIYPNIYIGENYPQDTLIILLSQPNYNFVNISNRLDEKSLALYTSYKKGELWNPERHHLFPRKSRQMIQTFLVLINHFSRLIKLVFPKPLIIKIIHLSLLPFPNSMQVQITSFDNLDNRF